VNAREQTLEFFARWAVSFDEMCASFREHFGAGCVWDQRPMIKTTGPDHAVLFLRVARRTMGLATIEVEVESLAVDGDTVHTARIDHLRRADGSLIASAPVAGVLTFDGGRIVHWREYFDSAAFAAQVLRTSVVWAGGRVLRGGARCAALRRSGDVRAGTASLGQMSASRAEGLTAKPAAL
jgi:limonene-1,2-epoxide hydrolase